MACAHDAERRPTIISSEEMAELEYALGCFNLALPTHFHLCTFSFDDEDFAKSNYILSTQLMIQTARVCLEKAKEAKAQQCRSLSTEYRNDEFTKKMASELVRIVHAWSPGRIPLNHPIMCCTLLGPGALFVQNDDFTQQSQEVSELFLLHCSKYWNLGKVMLRLLEIIKIYTESSQDVAESKEKELVRRFSMLIPPHRKRRCSIASANDPDPRLPDLAILNASLDFNQSNSSATEHLPVVDAGKCIGRVKDGNFGVRARPQNEDHAVSSNTTSAHSDSDKGQHNLFDNIFDDIGQYVSGDSPEFNNSFLHVVGAPGHVEDDWML
ncbi:uncharacterized protein A1O5_07724 [Cladophialophora psammophila CBS 110553]|uniref:Transcription factor domain-containing protein n=1 Tax=Cladophialophora psammophila CBS 110553 TaxID=1182543 RepID=W9WLJ3_9EURO|nr:uncharacterized protein A1O5_07724 [Cladophialophora psammophila CBS 110553]EXJ68793.1 hypothetical protein A1O5_07724 [Cladophialophora psammophila CBS 110553]